MRREQAAAQHLSTHGASVYFDGTADYPPHWFLRLVGQRDFKNVTKVVLWRNYVGARSLPKNSVATSGWYSATDNEYQGCDPNALPLLRDLTQLREITVSSLNGREFTPEDLRELGLLPHLEKLTILSKEFDADHDYTFSKNFPNLKYLNFADMDSSSPVGGKSLATMLEQLPNLEFLSLKGEQVTDDSLYGLRACHSMKRLRITDGQITHEGLSSISGANLQRLHLNHCGLSDSAAVGVAISQFGKLQSLHLIDCRVGDHVIRNLTLPKLREIILTHTDVTKESLPALKSFPSLKLVALGGNNIPQDVIDEFKRETGMKLL